MPILLAVATPRAVVEAGGNATWEQEIAKMQIGLNGRVAWPAK
jgi:hypothetical protein